VVLVDRETPGYDIPTINLDNRLGGRIATDFLLDRGHVDIVFATSDFTVAELRRSEGYRSAFADRGMELPSDSVVVGSEELWSEGICEPLSQMIEGGRIPSAIFASNDIKALHTMRILKEHDLRVPEDVSVVGYDDIFLSRIVVPSLTTVHQPFEHMVEAGVQLLLDMVKGVKVDTEQQLFEPWLMERSSTIVRAGGAVRTGLEDSVPISRGTARRALADLPTAQSIGAARAFSDNKK
jgi:LacI family transcriptional regulator